MTERELWQAGILVTGGGAMSPGLCFVEVFGRPAGNSLSTGRPRRVIGAFEAKTHLSRLLREVERGDSVTITVRGVAEDQLADWIHFPSGLAGRHGAPLEPAGTTLPGPRLPLLQPPLR